MLIRSEFDIQFQLPAPATLVAVLHLYPSLLPRLRAGNDLLVEMLPLAGIDQPSSVVPTTEYLDAFGNRCARFRAPAGHLRLSGFNIVDAEPTPDRLYPEAQQVAIEDLPSDAIQFLLPSRYCQVDQFGAIAHDLFGSIPSGWQRAVAIRDWVHEKVLFNYNAARPTKTAMDVFTERVGVCRDFQHLAITLSRCQNIPARYVTGYIGDIRIPYSGPGDFSAWYQVFLDGQWIDLDARHNYPRLGRILMAVGRDAADVAITTSFGAAYLHSFFVESNEARSFNHQDAGSTLAHHVESAVATANTPVQTTPTQTNSSQANPTQTQAATS